MPGFFELTLGYQLELVKRQIFHVVKQLFFFNFFFFKLYFVSVWISLLPNILTFPVNWISWQNITLEMLKDVTVNLLPFVHTAFGQNAFLFFSIITADRSHGAGGICWESEDLGLFCATCSELRAPQALRCLPGVCRGSATGGWGCPALPPPLLPFLPWFPPLSTLAGCGLVCNSGPLLW